MTEDKNKSAEIFAAIDEIENEQAREKEVLGALYAPRNAREKWIASALPLLTKNALFERIDAFQGERLARWLKEGNGKLTSTGWKSAWLLAKKYQKIKEIGKAPEL